MQQLHPKAVWLFFWRFLLSGFLVFLIIFFFFLSFLMQIRAEINLKTFVLLFLGFILYIIFCYILAKLTYHFWRYQLTEDTIKIEKGVIWKKYISIPYERIQNIDIYRGVLARLLGLSELHIQTAGYSGLGAYGGVGTEGRLPGLDIQTAEQLREELIKKVKGTKQGL